MTKDVVQKEFINRANKLKLNSKGNQNSTMVTYSQASMNNIHALRKRVKTREENRPRNRNNMKDMTISAPNHRNYNKNPSQKRLKRKDTGKNLRIRKKKGRKMSIGLKKVQVGNNEECIDKSQNDINSNNQDIQNPAFLQNHSFKMNEFLNEENNNTSPPDNSYIQVDDGQDPPEIFDINTPMENENPAIFNINIKSSMSNFTEIAQKFNKVKVIDWEESRIFQMVLNGNIELKTEKATIFNLDEIDYIVHMMKKRYRDFKTTDLLNPFFRKGKNTLQLLMHSLEIGQLYEKIDMNYNHITLENCFKILIR